jgi:hypothetical protein
MYHPIVGAVFWVVHAMYVQHFKVPGPVDSLAAARLLSRFTLLCAQRCH